MKGCVQWNLFMTENISASDEAWTRDYLVLQLRVWKLLRWSNHQKLIRMIFIIER